MKQRDFPVELAGAFQIVEELLIFTAPQNDKKRQFALAIAAIAA